MPTKFFEWNKTDLSQFADALVDGPLVSSSSKSVVTDGGLKWIEISVTSTGSPSNGAETQSVLLLSGDIEVPSDLIFVADMISVATPATPLFLAGVVARYSNVNAGYVVRYGDPGVDKQRSDKLGGTIASPTITQLGVSQSEPAFAVSGAKDGCRMGIGVEGQSWVRLLAGEEQLVADLSSPHVSGGTGLFVHVGTSVGTNTIRFRNICGYDLTI